MFNLKSKENILVKELYDISSLDNPINLEIVNGIYPNRKLQIIFFNLIWGIDAKLPDIDGIKSFFILLNYFNKKFNEIKNISLHLLSRKKEVYFLLIKQLLKLSTKENEKEIYNNISQYIYDKDFFSCFLIVLNKLNNSEFFEKFQFFSRVSKYIYLTLIFQL